MTDDLVALLWARNRDRVLGHVAELSGGLAALAEGRPADTVALARLAHRLAGSLGTYGRPGSDVARRVERALAGEYEAAAAAGLLADVRSLAADLTNA